MMQELSTVHLFAFWFGPIPPEEEYTGDTRMEAAKGRQLPMEFFQSREMVLAAILAGL